MKGCISETTAAVGAALGKLSARIDHLDELLSVHCTSVWAGYAGCARRSDHLTLYPLLQETFPNAKIRLTSDAELLTAPLAGSRYSRCVTLICGTGSLALVWQREPGALAAPTRQVGRSGGWGPLLGDEASGWSVGKAAIKSALTYAANERPLLPWHHAVMARFEVDDVDRLISGVSLLDISLPHAEADSERKRRIASCSRIVVEAAIDMDSEATRILAYVAAEVVDLLRPLVGTLPPVNLRETMLIVTGGLSQADAFWEEVQRKMASEGWEWGEVMKVSDAAMTGLERMIREVFE